MDSSCMCSEGASFSSCSAVQAAAVRNNNQVNLFDSSSDGKIIFFVSCFVFTTLVLFLAAFLENDKCLATQSPIDVGIVCISLRFIQFSVDLGKAKILHSIYMTGLRPARRIHVGFAAELVWLMEECGSDFGRPELRFCSGRFGGAPPTAAAAVPST